MILIAGIAELCALFRRESAEEKAKRAHHMLGIDSGINSLARAFLNQEPVNPVIITQTMINHMKAAHLDFTLDETYRKFGLKGVDDFLLLEQGSMYSALGKTIQSIRNSIHTLKTNGIESTDLNEKGRQLLQDTLDKFRTPSTLIFAFLDEMGRLPLPMKQRMAKACVLLDHLAEMGQRPMRDDVLHIADQALTLVQDTKGEIFALITARQSNQAHTQRELAP